ncbi:hypothetical protein [Mesorhizobium sp.]|uniref:hypothetical protein n=1 Tax=Mesorhizobium sp. TaxID=1871066 RepID=UPI000FE95F23|nr:hypothetical protein [Mesorhizobium sp.]RWP69548.1 MAG: hypothetical protein EOR07_03205 [Mesorhizobium sp.]
MTSNETLNPLPNLNRSISMDRNIAAFTAFAGHYPPYISINEAGGAIEVSIRSAEKDGDAGSWASISLTKEQFDSLIASVIAHAPVEATKAAAAQALNFAAGQIGGMKRAAAHANIVGYHSEAYWAAELDLLTIAEKVKRGEEVRNHNGLVQKFGGES